MYTTCTCICKSTTYVDLFIHAIRSACMFVLIEDSLPHSDVNMHICLLIIDVVRLPSSSVDTKGHVVKFNNSLRYVSRGRIKKRYAVSTCTWNFNCAHAHRLDMPGKGMQCSSSFSLLVLLSHGQLLNYNETSFYN